MDGSTTKWRHLTLKMGDVVDRGHRRGSRGEEKCRKGPDGFGGLKEVWTRIVRKERRRVFCKKEDFRFQGV